MKIAIWIRPDESGVVKIRTDRKYESKDTPRICATGERLLDALEGRQTAKDAADLKRAQAINNGLKAALAIDLGNLPNLELKCVRGGIYALDGDVWNRMSVVVDCVNAIRTMQKGLKDERQSG